MSFEIIIVDKVRGNIKLSLSLLPISIPTFLRRLTYTVSHTYHTLSIDTGVVGLTDVAGLGAASRAMSIAYVAWRAGTYREAGAWWVWF